MITWHNQDPPKLITKPKEYKEALEAMTNFSPFKNSQELLDELAQIENTGNELNRHVCLLYKEHGFYYII